METGLVAYGALTAILVIAFLTFVRYVVRTITFGKKIDRLPGEPRHWLYGSANVLSFSPEDMIKFEKEMVEKYPRIYRFWFGPLHAFIILSHPDTAKVLLKGNEPKIFNGDGYRELVPWLGEGLVMSHGKKWQRNRRLLTPAFHFDTLKHYWDINMEAVDILIERIQEKEEHGSIEVFHALSMCTLNILLRCAFSDDSDVQNQGDNNDYVKAVNRLNELLFCRLASMENEVPEWVYRYLTSNGRECYRLCNFVHKLADDVIKTRKDALKKDQPDAKSSGKYLHFLDILLSARDSDGVGLSDLEIRNEVDTFMFAGYDTTSAAVSWILYALAQHPEHQATLYEEVNSVLSSGNPRDILNLPYLSRCIKEALLYTPVPYVGRVASKDFDIDGYTIPQGSYVTVSVHSLHHNPAVWNDPDEFQPDRFLPENMKDLDHFAYVPFSAGPRNCIGQNFAMQEIKLIVAKLVQRFRITADKDHKVVPYLLMVMKAKDGIKLHFSDRH